MFYQYLVRHTSSNNDLIFMYPMCQFINAVKNHRLLDTPFVISVLTEMNTPQSIQRRRNQLHKTDITFHTLIITLTHQIQNDKTHNDTSHYVHTHSNMRTKIWPTAHSHMIQMYVHIFKRANPLVQTSLVHCTHQSGSQYTPVWFTDNRHINKACVGSKEMCRASACKSESKQ